MAEEQRMAPALFHHCKKVYNAMMEVATEVQFDNDTTGIVYEGMLTELVTEKLYLSVPYYSFTTKSLKRMGCIKQLRRGGGSAPSQWELLTEPTEELWWTYVEPSNPDTQESQQLMTTGPQGPTSVRALTQQLRATIKRVEKLEEQMRIVIEALPDPEE